MKKVFITGASGFIGNKLSISLDKIGLDIRLLCRKPYSNFKTIICDLEKEKVPLSALESVDTVFHLAGFAHDNRDDSKVKHLYQKINFDTTVQLANLAVQSGVKRFIFVSSVKAGGVPVDGQCMTEEDQSEPKDIYGKTKREAELMLLEIGQKSGMHVSIVRSSLVYGPGVKGNLRLMLTGIKKGWFPPLPNTANRRSMIHVDDLIQALILVASDERANGEIFIATDGQPHSPREIYEAMCVVLNKSVPRWSLPNLLFKIAAIISPKMSIKINKLLGDECYSSQKLKSLGFKAQRSLSEMNETSF